MPTRLVGPRPASPTPVRRPPSRRVLQAFVIARSVSRCLKVRGYSAVRAPLSRGRAGASRALPGRTRGEEVRMRRCLRMWMTSSLRSAGVGSWHVGVRMRSLPLRAPKQGSAQLELLHFPKRHCTSHLLKHFLGIRGVVEDLGGAGTQVDGRSIVQVLRELRTHSGA